MTMQPVLIAGSWRSSDSVGQFRAVDPKTRAELPEVFPVSSRTEIETVVLHAREAYEQMRRTIPAEQRADFLEAYAQRLEADAAAITAMANRETGLPVDPRLAKAEMPRTVGQLRQAAAAARSRSWTVPTIDTTSNIRSMFGPIGPVTVFGPNNFPLAFNAISGGDFAAAIAAGNPVIAKVHPAHPETSRLMAEHAIEAARATGMPSSTVQMIYHMSPADGLALVSHPLMGASSFTGSRGAGVALKQAADAAGKPIYLEMSSLNPLLVLPGAIDERGDAIATEYRDSVLLGCGQFCTKPGLLLLIAGDSTERFLHTLTQRLAEAPVGTLLTEGVQIGLNKSVSELQSAGAKLLTGGQADVGPQWSFTNTLLRVTGNQFLNQPALQTEAFGNAALVVVASDASEMRLVLDTLDGQLTGCIYSHTAGADDEMYDFLEPSLRQQVGRLLNDKMPTGVAVVASMQHGGPFPATGHPGFTAVGIPASLHRFAQLQCYDNVRPHRLPAELRNENHASRPWRLIDGTWTQADIG